MEDEIIEDEEDYSYDTSSNDFNQEGNAAVMKNFFDLTNYISQKVMKWRGFTLINGEPKQTHDPIGPDSFVYGVIDSLDSVLSQHNSVSWTKKEEANRILFENFKALNETIYNHPLFNENAYPLFSEEFDHMLELFMGLVINGHGAKVAAQLQAGIVASESNTIPEKKSGMMQRFQDKLNGE
jgi:hypothetical protein